jgi:anti-sigma factor RsiW
MMTNEHIDSGTLIDYLHGELAPEQDAAVLAHLADCSACAEQYDGEAALTERVRAHAHANEREMPFGIVARVRAQLDAPARPSWLEQLSLLLRPAIGVPVAAVLAVGIALGISSLHPAAGSAPAIAASYYIDDHAALSTHALPFTQTPVVPEALQPSSTTAAATVAIPGNAIATE